MPQSNPPLAFASSKEMWPEVSNFLFGVLFLFQYLPKRRNKMKKTSSKQSFFLQMWRFKDG
jgi:hypothetical protein